MTKKEKVATLLRKAHLIINAASGTDINKTTKEKDNLEARKVWKQIREIDPAIWEILKAEL